MLVSQKAFNTMYKHIASQPPERGGVLLGPLDKNLIDYFYPDFNGKHSRFEYIPDTTTLNKKLKEQSSRRELKGFAHSHPMGYSTPSSIDIDYAVKTLRLNPSMASFVMIIIEAPCKTQKEAKRKMGLWLIGRKREVLKLPVCTYGQTTQCYRLT